MTVFMESTTWLYSISLLSLLLLLLLRNFSPSKTRPPGPPSLPIIGHLHLLKNPLHRTLQRLSYHYGPILSLSFGSRPVLIISSPSLLEECFTKNDAALANRPRLSSGKYLNYNYTTIGAVSHGPLWRNLRRVAAVEIFSANKLALFLKIRENEVSHMLKKLFSSSKSNFTKVEMKSKFSEISFNIIMRMVSGKRYFGLKPEEESDETVKFRDMIKVSSEVAGMSYPGDFLPILRWFDFKGVKNRMVKLHEKSDRFLQFLVDEKRRNSKSSDSDDCYGEIKFKTMIDTLLSLQESEPEFYTDDIIKGLVLILLNAGTDTSAVTMEWTMALLLNHPSILKKARQELDREVGHTKIVEESDLPKLTYIQAIVNESLRLYPAVPLLAPHESSEECNIGGFTTPKGTMVLVNAWAIHRDPCVWDEPELFKPERFVEGEESDGWGYKMVAFGVGRRGCPGSGLAHKMVELATAGLIQCFEWERVGEEEIDMKEGFGLTMPKARPLEAMCKARDSMFDVLSLL